MAAGARARAARRRALRGASAAREERAIFRAEIERRAQELGLQPLRWPEPFPFDSALAMRVATYAKSIGRAVPFAQAAFRQAFAGGRSLADADYVLIAAAACEMHPAAVLRGARAALGRRAARAQRPRRPRRAGVREVPARAASGERRVPRRARALRARRAARMAQRAGGGRGVAREGHRAYRLIVTRGGLAPALLADPDARRPHRGGRDRQRRSGAVLGPARRRRRRSWRARCATDLAQLEAEEFIARWSTVEH